MPHRGIIGARKKRIREYNILKEIRDLINADTFQDILPIFKTIIKEHAELKRKLNGIMSEFTKKKIGEVRTIMDRKKHKSYNQGVLYFNKQHIGKRVVIWEKD